MAARFPGVQRQCPRAQSTLDAVKSKRLRAMRREHRPGRLLAARFQGRRGRASTSTSAARSPPRCSATPARCATRRSPRSSASPRCSRARSTSCRATPPGPSPATPALGLNFVGVNYYDGQGFMVPNEAQREERQAAERRHGLRAARHHHRAQPRRLLPRQQDDLQAGGDREAGGGAERLLRRALRRLHHRPLRPDLAARLARAQARRARDPARDHLQGAARAGGAPRRRPLVRRGEVVDVRDARGRGTRLCPARTSTSRRTARIRRSSASSAPPATSARCSAIDNKWALNIVKQVGNYGESFDANLKPLGFERGLNRLWNQGGLMYAPPIR